MTPVRRPWVNRLIVFGVIFLPIAAFLILQSVAAYTRSGSVDAVWFADTKSGPRMIARDQIIAGTEREAKVRNRLVLVDASNGERIAREKVDAQLDLVGVGADGLWFKRRFGDPGLHARDWDTLKLIEHPSGPAPEPTRRTGSPVSAWVTLAGERIEAAGADAGEGRALDPAQYLDGAFVVDEPTGHPITLDAPASAIVVHRPESDRKNTLLVSRVGPDLKPVWTAKLERQRAIRAAHVVGNTLVVVTSGIARDFAVALDLHDGHTVWVHHF